LLNEKAKEKVAAEIGYIGGCPLCNPATQCNDLAVYMDT
jgi:hypothetical protein